MKQLAQQARPIVRNDLRLFWRELRGPGAGLWTHMLFFGLLAVLHGVILVAMWRMKSPPHPGVEVLAGVYLALGMLGGSVNRAVQLLYTRSDFDLLLSSPLPARAVLLARLASVALTAGLGVSIFTAPVLNGLILRVSPRYVAGYGVLALMAVIAAAAGTGLCVFLVRWFGARLARFMTVGIAAILASSFPLAFMLLTLLPKAKFRELQQSFAEAMQHPTMTFVAGANRGEPAPLVLLAIAATVSVVIALRLLARTFVAQVQETSLPVARRRKDVPHRWTQGAFAATCRKEYRVITRSPLLLVQLLPAGLILLPAVVISIKLSALNALAPVTLFFSAFFSFLLADVASAGEVGWDLVRLSPASEARLRHLKMAACMAAPLALATGFCGWLAVAGRPGLALVTLLMCAICAAGCAWVAVVTVGPSPRYDLIQPPTPSTDLRQLISQIILFPGTIGLGLCAYEFYMLAAPFLGVAVICVIASFTLLEPRTAP